MATLRQTFSDIASAIRAKGITGTMKPIEMASKIGQIQTGGGGSDYGYLTFTSYGQNTITILREGGDISPLKLLKSTDGVNWTKWENPSTNGISLNALESVYLKADEDASSRTGEDNWNYNHFYSTSTFECSGDIRSIINPIIPSNYNSWFRNLFFQCIYLITAPELPATTLTIECYHGMFCGCSFLMTPPELPATTLADFCYQSMFSNCTSLTQAPVLPATTLAQNCYNEMFYGCTSLKRIKMNASLWGWGSDMFNGCTSLELVDMTGSTGVPILENVNNFDNTNDTFKIVVPDDLYDTWIAETNWASIASHIMKQSDWNNEHPDDILGQQ